MVTYMESVMTEEKQNAPLTIPIELTQKATEPLAGGEAKIEFDDFSFYYAKFKALGKINMKIPAKQITAIIGPSGCGKSTMLRSINRMNDLVANVRTEGQICYDGENILDRSVDVVNIRRKIGMVFQRPNPFPKSIYDNVAYGPRLYGIGKRQGLDQIVEDALRQAALWEEVKDKLNLSAMALSGGQQQRLCIARALAVQPEVILMDEPASALDPVATLKIEELMQILKETYTIIIVTHNMQQAARVSDLTAFMMIDNPQTRTGILVEFGPTAQIFTNPKHKQTEDYVTGRFG
jgi:phosphate transport system ATP-binding protein